jgi:folate-binding protein YgfZ
MSISVVQGQKTSPEADSHTGTGRPEVGGVRAEFAALISGCGVYDLSDRARVALTGKDRVRWLNGMVSNKIRDLDAGQGVYAFVLNPQGHILGDLYVYNTGESLLVDTEQAQLEKLLAIFKRYIIMDDVRVENVPQKLMGIAGPKSRAIAQAAEIDLAELGPLQFVSLPWHGSRLTVARGDNAAVTSYEFWPTPAQYGELWEGLLKAGAAHVSDEALDLLRVASGAPRYGQDIRERDLPQETDQQRALSFTKGCYIGQEIVERIRSRGAVRRKFTGFLVEDPALSVGTKIQVEGKDAGEITSVASLPLETGELTVALGYLRREAETPGKQIDAGGSKLTISKVPFPQIFKD